MKTKVSAFLDELVANNAKLDTCRGSIVSAFELTSECYRKGGKLLVCGNGGSAADALHIVGELMKGYLLDRRIGDADARRVREANPDCGEDLCSCLQGTLKAIALVSEISLVTAYANDVSFDMVYAQQVYGYGRMDDVLVAISTSGNAQSVVNAARVARSFGLKVVGLTGAAGGALAGVCDVAICAPADATWRIQEYHQAIYHALCAMLEEEFFGDKL